jgi:hypothetical protein
MLVMASSSTGRIIILLILLSVALLIYMNPRPVGPARLRGWADGRWGVKVGALSTEAARPLHAKITGCRTVSIR